MASYYDRYAGFREEGMVKSVPFIPIEKYGSDVNIIFDKETMRMDTLSYKYYGDADYGWLILQANPSLGGFEFSIPNGSKIRIPYPLSSAIQRYEKGVKKALEKK